jgi:hypothetical protein
LATRLEQRWHEYEAAEKRPNWSFLSWPLVGKRGPIRHPRAYRFLAALQASSGDHWISLLFSTVASSKKHEQTLRRDSTADMHLNLCEISDIVDELERRLAQREGVVR